MNDIILNIKTINDALEDFEYLFTIWDQVKDIDLLGSNIVFDFSDCRFLKQNAVAFLGGLIRYAQSKNAIVKLRSGTLDKKVHENLKKNGFLNALGVESEHIEAGNAIPFRQDKTTNTANILDYLGMMWLGKGWVNVSDELKNAIVGKVWEIYANAFEHSKSHIGVFSCGQHFPNQRELKLTVIDFGIGIPNNVKNYRNDYKINDHNCLEWAFLAGTSTNRQGKGRGLGLDLLKEFVKINKGGLEVYSNSAYGVINNDKEKFSDQHFSFSGTIINITLKCDESIYKLSSEIDEEILF